MIDNINEMHDLIKEKLTQEIANYEYRFERYNQNYSIAIGYTTNDEDVDLNQMASSIRESDCFITIQPNLCAVILDCTDGIKGVQAANKMLTIFNNTFYSKKIYAGVVTASEHATTIALINELYNIIKFAVTNNMDNMVVDSSQLDIK